MNASGVRRAVKFMRDQFTHLDTQIVQDGNLHPDLFIEEHYVTNLADKIDAREADPSLPKIHGKMEFVFKDSGK